MINGWQSIIGNPIHQLITIDNNKLIAIDCYQPWMIITSLSPRLPSIAIDCYWLSFAVKQIAFYQISFNNLPAGVIQFQLWLGTCLVTFALVCRNNPGKGRKRAKKWYGSAVTAATETRVNATKPPAETRVNRRVSATVSHISTTFSFKDSWYFVLCLSQALSFYATSQSLFKGFMVLSCTKNCHLRQVLLKI